MPNSTPPRRRAAHATTADLEPGAHRSYLCLAVAAAAAAALVCLAGCQTARAPTTVAPPATGMIGQPAPYGVQPQPMGPGYPAAPPMPGPATQWQASAPVAPPQNGWTWAQPQAAAPAYPAAPQIQTPNSQSIANQAQQYGNQMQAQGQQFAGQMQNSANQQWQQMANQAQGQANQYMNQAGQQANQYMNQAGQQANQYMNQAGQQAQQYVNGAQQQVTAQMPTGQPPAVNTSWNPFSTSALTQPPARATPAAVPRY